MNYTLDCVIMGNALGIQAHKARINLLGCDINLFIFCKTTPGFSLAEKMCAP